MRKQRIYLTAVSIDKGIITLIMPNGYIGLYRQRGLDKMHPNLIKDAINQGLLVNNYRSYDELPSNISISFEEPSIMGVARVTFNKKAIQ